MKLYTEEEILNAYYNGWHYRSVSFVNGEVGKFQFYRDVFINSLTPIELPSDEEIKQQSHIQYPVNLQPNGRTMAFGKYDIDINYSERNAFIECAKWMRDKIQGGNK
jgi:hypothetical protein